MPALEINSRARRRLVAALAVAGVLASIVSLRAVPAASEPERILVESPAALGWVPILRQDVAGVARIQVGGHLVLPEGVQSPVPVVVIVHSSGGLGAKEREYARALSREGIGAALPDSFTPRGVRHTGRQQESVTSLTMVADAYAVLNRLVQHPRVDPRRIGVVGFSKGGTVAMLAADEHFRRALADGTNRFAAHVAFYPSCATQLTAPRPTAAPLLMLMGELDSYTPAEQCERYVGRIRGAGFAVRSIVYRGAPHAWDSRLPVHSSEFDYSYGRCTIELDESGRAVELTSGLTLDSTETIRKAISICGTPGVVLGRHEGAAEQSRLDLMQFLKEAFGMSAAPGGIGGPGTRDPASGREGG